MAKGIKFIRRANMWCVYDTKNTKGKSDESFWFSKEEDALLKLKEVLASN